MTDWRVLAAAVLCLARLSAGADRGIEAVRTAAPPMVDGRLDDACWKTARPVTGFLQNNTAKPAVLQTTVSVLYDDTTLYLGFTCHESNVKDIVSKDVPFDNGDVFRGDCIEIMLDPRCSGSDYFHFAVNVSGARFDRRVSQGGHVGDDRWNGQWRAGTSIGADAWFCEVAIPFYTLGLTPDVGATWKVNFCREKVKPYAEISSIAEEGAFNIAGRFVTLRGLEADFRRYAYLLDEPKTETRVEEGRLSLLVTESVTNATGAARTVLVERILLDPQQRPHTRSKTVHLEDGATAALALDPFLLEEQGEYESTLRVADPLTKRPLAVRRAKLTVAYVPLAIRWIEPWYRDAVFASMNLPQVTAEVSVLKAQKDAASLDVGIRVKGIAAPLAAQTLSPVQPVNRVAFDNTALPEGDLEIVAVLKDAAGKSLEQSVRGLRKLPYRKGEVWLGRGDRVWRVDGRPFFINGAWGYAEDRNPWFNAYTGFSSDAVKGIAYLYIPEDMRDEFRNDRLSVRLMDYIRAQTLKAAEDPNLLMHYLSDEPEVSGTHAKALKAAYDVMRDADPYHPIVISNDSLAGLSDYADCAEINGLHPYPPIMKDKVHNDFDTLVKTMDVVHRLWQEGTLRQTVAYLHQGFNYGDYGAVGQRIPTYLEFRNQNLLMLTMGATGILQFNRMVEHYPELRLGIPHLTKELGWLGEAIIAPNARIAVTSDHAEVKTLVKDARGALFLFVCNAGMTPRNVRLRLQGGEALGTLHVVSEDRTVTVKDGAFTDHFDAYEAHVYTTAVPNADLMTVRAVCDLIAAANAARRKPGNLVFQEYEGDGVVVRASSNEAGKYRRPENGLWHVVDGIISTVDHYKCLTWQDATPNAGPDWLEIQMPKPQSIGRVVVYPFEKSLKDYAVQAYTGGEWKDVAKVEAQNSDCITHVFPPVTTDRIRLFVTAVNAAVAKVTEVEVYAE